MALDDSDDLVRLLIAKRSAILAYARSIVFNQDMAEDVYQNVAVVILRKPDEARNADETLKWILGVTRLECLTALRKAKRAPLIFDEGLLDILDHNWQDRLASDTSTDARLALAHCLNRLTSRARRILELRYNEGLTGSALAEKINASLNTSYVALSRIHKQLRECIQEFQSRNA